MNDLVLLAHACISCAVLQGLNAAWNSIAGSFGGIGGVLSPAGPAGSSGSDSTGGAGSEGAPSRQSASGAVPPPAWTGPASTTVTPSSPTTVIGPDGHTHYFDPNFPSGGPTVPSNASPKAPSGTKGGSGGVKGPHRP